ncbi:lantibiotic dehydratase [Chryseobacterium wangxinyae]|uniref:lantibiotic dehydratase n=1 Tax=Chryseobacterium sp. CY353 TaxID=2997334 RepID=UPI0022701BAB|nr:lantibiotic dehydratase [Chryseobacterium sp. CY353]MCY0971131.1 lantibiotic dehydratase [Chryseobacterium sp. CY353]
MKIVSKAVARISSVPYAQPLLDKDIVLKNNYDEIFDLKKKFNNYKNEVLELLHNYNQTITEKKINNAIQNLRRDIFNQRIVKEKDLAHLNTDITDFVKKLFEIQFTINQKIKNFTCTFDKSLDSKQKELLKIFNHPYIQNGLLLSSHDLLKSSVKNIYNRKKQIQLETTILKYVTRTIFKPTPYSSFTTVNIVSIENVADISHILPKKEITSYVRLNNYIYRVFIEEILCREEIYKNLSVELNETFIQDNETKIAKVLINKNNLDYFYYFNMSDFIAEVVVFLTSKKHIKYCDLLIAFNMYSHEEVSAYINKLIEIGLIKFIYPVSGISENWVVKLIDWLKKIDYNTGGVQMIALLSKLEQLRGSYEKKFGNFSERLNLIEEAQKTINSYPFKNETFSIMLPKNESLFLEDTLSNNEMRLSNHFLKNKLEKLNCLITFANSQSFFERQQKKIFQFFNEFTTKKQLGLLEFYEAYIKKIKSNIPFQNSEQDTINLSDYFNFELDDSQVMFYFKDQNLSVKQNTSFSMFFQIFENSIIINNIGLGYGRMCSRFFHMFDPSFLEEVKILNRSLQKENSLQTEVNDSSFFNANMHPLLFDHECIIPGGHANTTEENIIGLQKLVVRKSKNEDKLILFDEVSQKEIIMHDSSFQGRKSRSQMFNFLLNFTDKVFPDFTPILKTINNKYSEEKGGYVIFPRIVFESNIILQRKYWQVSKIKLSSFLSKNKISNFFLEINIWRKENDIPPKLFVSISEGEDSRRDDYKPQFVDFENPIFANLLHKIFRRADQIVLTEFLPFLDGDTSTKNVEFFASEYLVQWYN